MGHPTERIPAPVPMAGGPDAGGDDGVRVSEPTTRVLPVVVPPTGAQATPVAIPAPLNAPRPEDAPTYVAPEPRRSRKPLVLTILGVVAVLGLYVAAQWSLQDRVPGGTTVAGVNVGGIESAEAVERLQTQLSPRAEAPVQVTAAGVTAEIDPAGAGLAFDPVATIDRLTGFSLNPVRLWAHLVGTTEARPAVTIDRDLLAAASSSAAEYLEQEPVDGGVTFRYGRPVTSRPQDGSQVSADAVAEALTAGWLVTTGSLAVPYDTVSPAIGETATADAHAQAELIVSAPVTVEVDGQAAELAPSLLAEVTTFEPVGGVLRPTFDGDALHAAVVERTTDLLSEPSPARFVFVEGRPEITGGEAGTTLDVETLAAAVQFAALGEERVAGVDLVEHQPELGRAELEALGVTEVVSSFSTGITADPVRTQNLRRGAEILTGYLILPGEQFSLLDALGPITVENGFGRAPVIVNGQFVPGVGGGLSQNATNVYNAAHFAGFQIDQRRPHTVFISRYPAGREATIHSGSRLDLQFTNNTPYGALLRSWVSGGQLHMQIWSTPYFRVESTASPRTGIRPAEMRRGPAYNCAPRNAGQDGFTITNTRRVFRRDTNELVDTNVHTWTYNPDHGTYCYTPAPPAPEEPAAPPADYGHPEHDGGYEG